jgi:hypothetical protein
MLRTEKTVVFIFSSTSMCALFLGGSVNITDKTEVKNKRNQKGQNPGLLQKPEKNFADCK